MQLIFTNSACAFESHLKKPKIFERPKKLVDNVEVQRNRWDTILGHGVLAFVPAKLLSKRLSRKEKKALKLNNTLTGIEASLELGASIAAAGAAAAFPPLLLFLGPAAAALKAREASINAKARREIISHKTEIVQEIFEDDMKSIEYLFSNLGIEVGSARFLFPHKCEKIVFHKKSFFGYGWVEYCGIFTDGLNEFRDRFSRPNDFSDADIVDMMKIYSAAGFWCQRF